ncbi:BON domain-containing protein [Flavisolibacter sp. BT320]|nr:BON domain-containing protein [Flavisolibacter longurius]
MANRNFNKRSQSRQSNQDWEQNRDRNREQYGSMYNSRQDYGDVGYSGDSAHGMGNTDYEGGYNRVNYIPDNNDNRNYGNRDQDRGQYGNTSGYRGNDRNDDWQRYGNAGYNDNRHDWNRRNMGDSWSSDSGWNRRQQSSSNWGDNDRQDWGRGNVNTGNYDSDRQYGNRGYGSNYGNMNNDYNRDWSRNRNAGSYDRDHRRDDNDNWWERTKDKVSGWFSDDDDNNDRDRNRPYSSHRGKGPSDYRRSQDRIREDICDRLTDDDRVDASNISVQIDSDAVILSGTVNSREEKRRAEDLVESVSGVRNVENRLRVGTTSGLASHDYTGTTDRVGGIGSESGTTNEIIRNVANDRSTDDTKNRNKTL